jgi:type II secretory pathway pseudopilin PulG
MSNKKSFRFLKKILPMLVGISLVISFLYFQPWAQKARAVNVQIRQEINIIDAYLGSNGAYATSSAIIQIDPAQYSSATYYFEVVASTTTAVSSNIYLKNATSSATVVAINFFNANTYTLYPSSNFTPPMATQYQVVVGNEGVQKGVIAARIVILQSADPIAKTETQIEIGSNVIATSSLVTTPLSNPKYWYYDATKWNPAPTFSVEVTYQNTQAASSTSFTSNATYKHYLTNGVSYLKVEAWGAGGGGARDAAGGGGGGGGAYAATTFATSTGSGTIVVGNGQASDSTGEESSTYNDTAGGTVATEVVAEGGDGSGANAGGDYGYASNSTGQTTANGGIGGAADTGPDTCGGGGGSGGPSGAGYQGEGGQALVGGAGGQANGGGAYQSPSNGGVSGAGTQGTDAATGGNGGGGGDTSSAGGRGGIPGGGGGGGDGSAGGAGGDGQIKLTETHGKVGIALEEDTDGLFGGWSFKQQIVTAGVSTSSPSRIRVSFTPQDGHNYRIVASTTGSVLSNPTYSIYNAKIIVDQTSPTKLEPQYLLANNKLASGANLQNFLTSWDSSQWVGVANTYVFQAEAADSSASDIQLEEADGGGTLATVTDPDNLGTGAATMPATQNLDVKATPTNNNDLYAARILVQVVVVGPPTVITNDATNVTHVTATLNGQIDDTGGSDVIQHGFAWGTVSNLAGGNTATTTLGATGIGAFSSNIGSLDIGSPDSLSCGTTYYFRAYAQNFAGWWGYGSSILSFISPCPTGATPNPNIKTEIQGGVRFLGGVRFK